MAKQKNLKLNMILSGISTVLGIIIPIITFPYFSRILLPEGLGLYSFLNSFVYYFYMFAMLGIATYGTICCSRVRDDKEQLNKTASELLLINIVLSVSSYSILIVVTFFIDKLYNNWVYMIIIGLSSITTVFNLNWLVQAEEEYVFSFIKEIILKILCIILLFIFVREKDDLIWYIYINMGISVVGNICNFFYAKRFVKFDFKKDINIKRHIKSILLYFAIALATSVFMDMDKILLGFMGGNMGDYYVGIYEVSSKINTVLITVISGTVGVIAPRMSYLVGNDQLDEFNNIMLKTLTYVFLFAAVVVIYFSFFGEKVIIVLLGDNYTDSIKPMLILLPIIVIKSVTNITNMYLMAKSKEFHMTIALIIGSIINVILNVSLIPKFNVIGVVIGTLVSEFFVMMYQLIVIRKFIVVVLKKVNYLMILEMCALIIPSMYLCYAYIHINFFADIIISGIILVIELLTIMILNKDEFVMSILNKIFRREHEDNSTNKE